MSKVENNAETWSNGKLMWHMLGLAKPMAGIMVLAVLFGVLGHLCATFLPVAGVAGGLTLAGAGSLLPLTVGGLVWLLVGLAIARGVLHYVEQTCNHYIAFKLLASIRDRVFGALRTLCPAKLAGADKGDLISTITSDVELLEVFYAHTISPVCIAFITSVVMVVFMGSFNPWFGLVALVAYVVVGIAVPIGISKSSGAAGMESRKQAGALSGFVLDNLRGLQQIIQFDAGDARMKTLDERSRALSDVQQRLSSKAGSGAVWSNIAVIVFTVIQMTVAITLCQAGSCTPEGAVVATVTLMSSFGPTIALANLGTTLQGTLASGRRVLAILNEEPLVYENTDGQDVAFDGACASHVGFSYGEEEILHDVSVNVPQGAIVGISGKSGSGKSTLCRLFMRFWDVDAGSIALSGKDVRDIRTTALRGAEALVEQDTYLFHDSIRDNLLIAKPDATDDELWAACRAASIDGFIKSLPAGMDTMVGELGSTMSGGERQRMGLARAFLHEAPFLLLDEPTSNLDSLNEGAILKSLDAQRGKRTVLLISHRASTMSIADRVVRMDTGRVS